MNCLVNAAQAEKMRNAALNGDDDDQETCSPRDIDILLGRGRTHFQHHGNRRFRKVVAKNLQAYLDTQSRYGKTKMVRKITEECLEGGTRFLRIKKDSNSWYQVRISVARDKVSESPDLLLLSSRYLVKVSFSSLTSICMVQFVLLQGWSRSTRCIFWQE